MLSFTSLRGGTGAGLAPAANPSSNPAANLSQASSNEVGVKPKIPGLQLKECGYYDVQKVQEICKSLVYALGAASVEKAIGGLFNQPPTVVEDMKKEMVDYVQGQVDAYAMGSTGSHSQSDPVKLIQDMLEGFVKSKKTLFRRVSSKLNLFGEKQDERVEGFVQEIEKKGCWVMGQREAAAKSYLRRVDRSRVHHCEMKFKSNEELAQHKRRCPLRPLMCENANCGEVVAAVNAMAHDETCPVKLLACQQKCKAMVIRADMAIHCSTMCPMKPVPCPFHEVGCQEALHQSMVEHHCAQSTSSHLSLVLQALLKQQASLSNQAQKILSMEKILSYAQLGEMADMGAMSVSVTEQEHKVKALEQEMAKLRQEFKLVDVSADVLQLRREVRNLQKNQPSSL